MSLNGNTDEANGYNSVIKNGVVANANHLKAIVPPIGAIISWVKTFDTADSGTTDSTTTNQLIESGQNFSTTISVNMIVYNTTDGTWAYVTTVDNDTTLTLSADIMVSGENYTIYSTPTLPDGWIECDGSVLSDSDSPYNGATIPDLNGDNKFLRSSDTSGTTGGSETHSHSTNIGFQTSNNELTWANRSGASFVPYQRLNSITPAATSAGAADSIETQTYSTLPTYYEVVKIMRIK